MGAISIGEAVERLSGLGKECPLFQSLRGAGRFSKGPAHEPPFSGKAGLSVPRRGAKEVSVAKSREETSAFEMGLTIELSYSTGEYRFSPLSFLLPNEVLDRERRDPISIAERSLLSRALTTLIGSSPI